jgi:hypothetical protein
MTSLWQKWQDLCLRIHRVPETNREQLTRLAHTPPEFWAPRDWTNSRRFRSRRDIALRKAQDNGGQGLMRVVDQYPEGKFWPRTPQYNEGWRGVVVDERLVRWIRDILGPHVDIFPDAEGEIWVFDLFTGDVVPAHWYIV